MNYIQQGLQHGTGMRQAGLGTLLGAYSEKAFDVDAIEVGLDFWNTAACCQGLNKSYQGPSHYGIPHTDADKGGIGCPETPCTQAANANNPAM